MITQEQFRAAVGFEPHDDDLERTNCNLAGRVGHWKCGWCALCNKPRFTCPHLFVLERPESVQ